MEQLLLLIVQCTLHVFTYYESCTTCTVHVHVYTNIFSFTLSYFFLFVLIMAPFSFQAISTVLSAISFSVNMSLKMRVRAIITSLTCTVLCQ